MLVEEFFAGRELTVGILGDEALPIIEIVPREGFYDYQHKYTKGASEYFVPAEIGAEATEAVQHAALSAKRALGLEVYSRVDVLLAADGRLNVLEINTIPGMTETSLLPKAAAIVGLDFPSLCEQIASLSRFQLLPSLPNWMANQASTPQGQPQTAQHTDARPSARRAHAHRNQPAETARNDRALDLQCPPHCRYRHGGVFRIAGLPWTSFSSRIAEYTLRRISFDLDEILTREEALAATGLREGVNIFSVDLAKVEAALRAIPQIENVRIDRSLPDQIDISITARRPVAWVAAAGEKGDPSASEKSLLVDASGFLLRPQASHA